ncbi:MAG: prepilin peptidase-dependent pilin [Leclercia adecarboxylata]|uniref:Prepilin peptidase-dependent pilin n=1 Tax=Leclercia adecarboxylata TaxID=83655 RepID=A0AAP9AK43_9ENTR|nr:MULTISPECIES: prepilin peptidase-dependent pilin [Leclercia]MDU1083283.1 prepilin peptidase-dependent pilin [Leclercia adecarboxylata]MDU4840257.1 prepilin peptidase-dependent pilin [Leclercia adecarboxylata]QDK19286.1 prepilin peptidase-dependent pilin [Leclercia adecarboxylata]QGU13848.1 prepilin peptidase-dependent pilin [Leclercia sp. 119287]UGB03089.1 prepilin peptidase-dependent pilin [Leclercia sp. G3L]
MERQKGFTLIELMVVIGIVAILSAIGIPAYQNYLRKAALTDMLQTFMPYRTAVELCALDHGGTESCDAGVNGIPSPATSRYVSGMSIAKGVVTLTGQESLNGLDVVMTPQWDNGNGITGWKRLCTVGEDSALKQACEEVFRFTAEQESEQ